MNEDEKITEEKLWKKKLRILLISFFEFLIMNMVYILFFLGALHGKFQYESTFLLDLNKSLGFMGTNGIYKIYEIGESNPNLWIPLSIAVFLTSLYFLVISPIIRVIKMKGGKNENEK